MANRKKPSLPRIPVQTNQTGSGAHRDKKKAANKNACRKSTAGKIEPDTN